MIRPAVAADYQALVAIEQRCFDSDRISRRQWRYMLTRAHADILVAAETDGLAGYVLVLYNQATSVARLYSIAVDASSRRGGLGRLLAAAAEEAARERGKAYMRLEIRRDNGPSQALFGKLGYRQFGMLDDYYEDHMQALRLQKRLRANLQPPRTEVPFYEQTLEFTCGASSLMMAMKCVSGARPPPSSWPPVTAVAGLSVWRWRHTEGGFRWPSMSTTAACRYWTRCAARRKRR